MVDARRNDTKKKLIETALDEIQEKGYENISIREIAKKNVVTAAAIYKHFGSKDELLLEVLKQASKKFEMYITNYLDENKTDDSYQKVILLGEANIRWNEEEEKLADFLFFSPVAAAALKEYIVDQNNSFIGLKRNYEIIADFVEEYQLKVDKNTIFIQLWSLIQGYATLIKNHICIYEREFIEKTLDTLIKGLTSK